MENVRTGVQRKTLIAALLGAGAAGALALGAVSGGDDDSPRRQEISEVVTTEETTTTVEVTTTLAPTTTAAPVVTEAPAPEPVASQPIEQQVAEHEERITDLEATTTTVPTTMTTLGVPCEPNDYTTCD